MEQPVKPTRANRRLTRGVFGILLVAVLLLGGVAWRHAHQNAWGKINFQTYAPAYLPDNLKIRSVTIDARYIPADTPSHTTMLNLTLSNDSYVYEQKNTTSFTPGCPVGITVHQACSTNISPQGQQYQLVTSIVPGQPVEQTFKWLKDATLMQATFKAESSQPYSAAVLGKVIDSFKPVIYKDLKTNYFDHSRV